MLLEDSKALRQPRRDLVVRNAALLREAALRPDLAGAETRGGARTGFFRAPLAAALCLATDSFGGAAFLRAAFLGSPWSTRLMAAATSAIGAIPSTAFKAPCRR